MTTKKSNKMSQINYSDLGSERQKYSKNKLAILRILLQSERDLELAALSNIILNIGGDDDY